MTAKIKILTVVLVVAAIATVIGTGAFSAVTAERSASIQVAGDSSALLQLTSYSGSDGNGQYANIEEGTLEIGEINIESNVDIDKVFQITNQGTQSVSIWIVDIDNKHNADLVGSGPTADSQNNTGAVTFYNASFGGAVSTENGVASIEGQENAVTLDTGETLVVSIKINTDDVANNEGNLLDSIVIHADARVTGAPGPNDA